MDRTRMSCAPEATGWSMTAVMQSFSTTTLTATQQSMSRASMGACPTAFGRHRSPYRQRSSRALNLSGSWRWTERERPLHPRPPAGP